MNKIVDKACKVDFHIHSCYSSKKDGSQVRNLTEDNIGILINKLNENEVNICSISDHDNFSYSMYRALKKAENTDNILKVLPAIEFTVSFDSDEIDEKSGVPIKKPLHIVTIFDDKDDNKVQHMGELFKNDKFKEYDDDENNCFTKKKFIEILSDIDISCLCMVHQKNSLSSEFEPQQNDLNSLGVGSYYTLLCAEFFDALEFRNRNIEIFHKMEMEARNKEGKDVIRFVTGTDCHDWNVYPATRNGDAINGPFPYTYLKCLPNFRGVSLALTDKTRIMREDNFFTHGNKYLENIKLTINDEDYVIPLSKGINVIIGENSIGKSLLLHELTNYECLQNTGISDSEVSSIKDGYRKFLSKHNVTIAKDQLSKNYVSKFDIQGEIRETFSTGQIGDTPYFEEKFPEGPDVEEIKPIVEKKLNDFCSNLETKFNFDKKRQGMNDIEIFIDDDFEKNVLSFSNVRKNKYSKQKNLYKCLKSDMEKAVDSLRKVLNTLSENNVDSGHEEEIKTISDSIAKLKPILETYKQRLDIINRNNSYLMALNNVFDGINESNNKYRTDKEEKLNNYERSKDTLVNNIATAIEIYNSLKPFNYHINEFDSDKPDLSPFNSVRPDYKFYKYINAKPDDDTYVKDLFHHPFTAEANKKEIFNNIHELIENVFEDALLQYNKGINGDAVEFYKARIKKDIDEDFKLQTKIVKGEDDDMSTYSSGANSQIYFDILANEEGNDGIYIIDQPEDDVSPTAIKKYLLEDFRKMRRNKQIILVTHNPQFVVNLDADNVIYLFYNPDKDGDFDIRSGALEYIDDEYSILRIVADALDGGIESIRKRWKNYEQDDNDM